MLTILVIKKKNFVEKVTIGNIKGGYGKIWTRMRTKAVS